MSNTCALCGQSFTYIHNLRQHEVVHQASGAKRFRAASGSGEHSSGRTTNPGLSSSAHAASAISDDEASDASAGYDSDDSDAILDLASHVIGNAIGSDCEDGVLSAPEGHTAFDDSDGEGDGEDVSAVHGGGAASSGGGEHGPASQDAGFGDELSPAHPRAVALYEACFQDAARVEAVFTRISDAAQRKEPFAKMQQR